MGTSFLILIFGTIISYVEVTKLIKKKLKKEAWYFSVFMFFALLLSSAFALEVYIPNPLDLITLIYKPIIHLF